MVEEGGDAYEKDELKLKTKKGVLYFYIPDTKF